MTHKLFILCCSIAVFLIGCQSASRYPQNQNLMPEIATISVIGRGTTKEEAIQDALRIAVEKATGVFIYSVTDVENFQLVKDKIATISRGYVKNYEIMEEKNNENMIFLSVSVTVNEGDIKSTIRKELKSLTYDDVLKDYSLIKQKVEKLKKSAELLKSINSRPLEEMYIAGYEGYEIKAIGLKKVKIIFKVRIWKNPFFWNTYYKILDQVSDSKRSDTNYIFRFLYSFHRFREIIDEINKKKDEDYSVFCAKYEPTFLVFLGVSGETYKIHKDLMEFILKERKSQIIIQLPGDIVKSSMFTLDEIFYDDGYHYYYDESPTCEYKRCKDSVIKNARECILKEGIEVLIEYETSNIELLKNLSEARVFFGNT